MEPSPTARICAGLLSTLENPTSEQLNEAQAGAELVMAVVHHLFRLEIFLRDLAEGANGEALRADAASAGISARLLLALLDADGPAVLPEFEALRKAMNLALTYSKSRAARVPKSTRELLACLAQDVARVRLELVS